MEAIMPINGQFEMMTLPYTMLGAAISVNTLSFHHGKHLKTYIDNLNKALPNSGFEGKSLQEVVRGANGGMLNNAGQVLNHMMYFEQFSNTPVMLNDGMKLKSRLENDFGSVEAFKKEFGQKAISLFGSGWVWLSVEKDGKLVITQNQNADNPLCHDCIPLLTFDVWEHAYYLDYQNRRADYVDALWAVLDWRVVENRFNQIDCCH